MEEDIQLRQVSPKVAKTRERVEHRLKKAVELAANRLDYEAAHDDSLQHALSIVELFIKRKKRVCYGGTAMNAILPKHRQFYDPNTDLPDYDFYTPDVDNDVKELVADLEKEGYEDVYSKLGIHEGTMKVLVNYVAVADISFINPELFAIMYRRSVNIGGLHYTDPDILRMMMYLEISRPRGMVERWEKVFERLQLINQEFPIRVSGCNKGQKQHSPEKYINKAIRKAILDYGIQHNRILCNGSLGAIYASGIRRGKSKFEVSAGGPLLFSSPDPVSDAKEVRAVLDDEHIKLYMHPERSDLVPLRIELRRGDKPVCMFMKETACHSLNKISMSDGRKINIASLEFLITLYLSIEIFTNHSRDYLGERIMCQVKRFIELSEENYRANDSQFPPFSLECQGYQVGYASLLKAKVERVKKEKEARKKSMKKKQKAKVASKSRKASSSKLVE